MGISVGDDQETLEELYSYGMAHYRAGSWKEAVEAFQILCAKNPLQERFWLGLGAALQESGRTADALYGWAVAALLEEKNPYPHFHAAECYLSMNNLAEAQKALRAAEERIDDAHASSLREKIHALKTQWSL